MARHCEDNAADRAIGAVWEENFCEIAKDHGFTFTSHQLPGGRIAAAAYYPGGHIILPDITLWKSPGQHHEVKHKNPTVKRQFGLESYRFDSLLLFQDETGVPVHYTIHNWALAGGRDKTQNRIEDWVTCDVTTLQENRGMGELGESWVNGKRQTVSILYWPVMHFRPLSVLWRDAALRAHRNGKGND